MSQGMPQLRQVVFGSRRIQHGVLPEGSAGRNKTHLPSGRRSQKGTGENGMVFSSREYSLAYNRLKSRKQRETLSVEEWNHQVAHIQEMKAALLAGEMSDAGHHTKMRQV